MCFEIGYVLSFTQEETWLIITYLQFCASLCDEGMDAARKQNCINDDLARLSWIRSGN